jgi:hypothetical protein
LGVRSINRCFGFFDRCSSTLDEFFWTIGQYAWFLEQKVFGKPWSLISCLSAAIPE